MSHPVSTISGLALSQPLRAQPNDWFKKALLVAMVAMSTLSGATSSDQVYRFPDAVSLRACLSDKMPFNDETLNRHGIASELLTLTASHFEHKERGKRGLEPEAHLVAIDLLRGEYFFTGYPLPKVDIAVLASGKGSNILLLDMDRSLEQCAIAEPEENG